MDFPAYRRKPTILYNLKNILKSDIKETVSVMPSDHSWKHENAQFTKVPLNP